MVVIVIVVIVSVVLVSVVLVSLVLVLVRMVPITVVRPTLVTRRLPMVTSEGVIVVVIVAVPEAVEVVVLRVGVTDPEPRQEATRALASQ